MPTDNLSELIVKFLQRVRSRGVPRRVREIAKEHLLDGFAVMLGGAPEEASRRVRAHVAAMGGRGEARVVGTALKVPCQMAALANGVQGHVLDYDDAQLATAPGRPLGQQVHPTTAGAGCCTGAGGENPRGRLGVARRLRCRRGGGLPAGGCRGAGALHGRLPPYGTLGVFGAAAACAYLLGLDRERIGWALGIAGGLSSGLPGQPGHHGQGAERRTGGGERGGGGHSRGQGFHRLRRRVRGFHGVLQRRLRRVATTPSCCGSAAPGS